MILASRLGASAPGRVAALVGAAALVAAAAVLVHGRGGPGAVTIPPPARVELVYAKPIGIGLTVRSEEIYAASPTGSHPVPLAEGTDPLVSPDGRWVAYTGGAPEGPSGIRLVSTLGGPPRITRIPGYATAWSPDSRLIVVAPSHAVVVLVDVRTLQARRLALHPGGYGFTFSPDGSALAYETSGRHGPDILSG